MLIFKCKMCGGDIQAETGAAFGTCDSCGMTSTLPKANEERLVNLFNRANHFRRLNEFDKAIAIYENILNEDSTNAEAHWCVVLCRYGIEYVEDPKTYQRVPTCHRTQFALILTDADYLAALENVQDSYTKGLYESEAKKISEIQKGILAISSQEQPYDIFICYKETTDGGSRTKDSTIAQDIYYQLADDYKVFFAKITLEDKLGQESEPYIFNALNSAKVMLVLGTKKEHFEAVWVKNEWSRFLALMKNDRSRLLIPCYRDMDAYDIPDELAHFQALDMSKIGFVQDLVRGVDKVLTVKMQDSRKTASENNLNADLGLSEEDLARVKRGFIFLENEDWEKAKEYFEYAAEMAYVPAYLGLMGARWERSLEHVKQVIADNPHLISDANDFNQIVRFESMYVAQVFLEVGRWDEADSHYDAVLDKDPEYGPAYDGKLKAELGIVRLEQLADAERFSAPLTKAKNYKNALRFSNQEQREWFEKYNQAIVDLLEAKESKAKEEAEKFAKHRRTIAAGSNHTATLNPDGSVSIITELSYISGGLVEGYKARTENKKVLADARDIVAVYATGDKTVALRSTGELIPDMADKHLIYKNKSKVISLACAGNKIILVREDGRVFDFDEEFDDYEYEDTLEMRNIKEVTIGGGYVIGLRSNGIIVTVPYTGERLQWDIKPFTNIISIAARGNNIIGLKKDGTVVTAHSAGYDNWSNIVSVAAGYGYYVGLKADGTVVASGRNDDGQCNVGDWRDIVAIAAGSNHTVGLMANGVLVAVGNNNTGQCRVSQEIIEKEDAKKRDLEQSMAWEKQGWCFKCGGKMGGFISKKCKSCGYVQEFEDRIQNFFDKAEDKVGDAFDRWDERQYTKQSARNKASAPIPATTVSSTVERNNVYEVGQTIFARWGTGKNYYPGTIENITGEQVDIQYLDGDKDTVSKKYIMNLQEAFNVLQLQGNWKNYGTWYGCKVIKTEPLTVKYDDGMSEKVKLKQLCGTLK